MDQKETVTRIRRILADARLRRGLASDETIAAAMNEAMQIAVRGVAPPEAPYPIRRKHLLAQINLKAKHYDLRDEVDGFVFETGHESLNGLTLEQLNTLNGWLAQCVDDLHSACDSRFAPPAR